MTFDPWTGIRKWAKEFRKRGKGGDYTFLSLDETDELLADADALLTLVPVLEQIADYPFGGHTPPEMRKLASEALADLPKHLRRTK